MAREGIICAGAWCVDRNIVIDHWPAEETLAVMHSIEDHGGCPGHNMSTALKRLGAPFPVEAMGLVGTDTQGRFLIDICDRMGIERSELKMRADVETALVLAMTSRANRKRTFFYHASAHSRQTPDDFDFSRSNARIVHLGLPGLHFQLDNAWKNETSGWVAVLKKARAAGLKCNMELASVEAERIRAAALPMLPWLDTIIINDHEAGAITEIATVENSVADAARCREAAIRLMEMSTAELVAVHYPHGGVLLARDGSVVEMPSVDVPRDSIAGSNGAGDCFAAGILLGHHEGWPMQKSLRLAHASAAASLRAESTTAAVLPWNECLAQADRWGWRSTQ